MKVLATTHQHKTTSLTRRQAMVALVYLCAVAVTMILMTCSASGQATKKERTAKASSGGVKDQRRDQASRFLLSVGQEKRGDPSDAGP